MSSCRLRALSASHSSLSNQIPPQLPHLSIEKLAPWPTLNLIRILLHSGQSLAINALVTGLGVTGCCGCDSCRLFLCCSRHFQYSNDGFQLPPHLSQWRDIRLLSSGEKFNSSVLHTGHFIVNASANQRIPTVAGGRKRP